MARTLADLFTPEEKARFDDLYRRGGITDTTAQLFADRFASEVDDIEYRLRENTRVRKIPFHRNAHVPLKPYLHSLITSQKNSNPVDRRHLTRR